MPIPITGSISPLSIADTYPTHEDIYGLGGFMVASRTTIPAARMKVGMLVRDGSTTYRLSSTSPITWVALPDEATVKATADTALANADAALAAASGFEVANFLGTFTSLAQDLGTATAGKWWQAGVAGTMSHGSAGGAVVAIGDRMLANGSSWTKWVQPPTYLPDGTVTKAKLDATAKGVLDTFDGTNKHTLENHTEVAGGALKPLAAGGKNLEFAITDAAGTANIFAVQDNGNLLTKERALAATGVREISPGGSGCLLGERSFTSAGGFESGGVSGLAVTDRGNVVAPKFVRRLRAIPRVPWDSQVTYREYSSGVRPASPSIIRAPDGQLIACHDIYGTGYPVGKTRVYRSTDEGATWTQVNGGTELSIFWGSLFISGTSVFLLGIENATLGDIRIIESTDNGLTWGSPVTLVAAGSSVNGGWHKAPVPVVSHGGKFYCAVEDGPNATKDACLIVGNPAGGGGLTNPANWALSNRLAWSNAAETTWRTQSLWLSSLGGLYAGSVGSLHWLEGNFIVRPGGTAHIYYRVNFPRAFCPVINADISGAAPVLTLGDPIRFPLAHSKFHIVKDSFTGLYIAVGNVVRESNASSGQYQRHIGSMYWSSDALNWNHGVDWARDRIIWQDAVASTLVTGFQYPSLYLDGLDALVLSRTAYSGPTSAHEANRITFHRIPDWRAHCEAF